ncbi:MAG: Gfo/Idh/MocA family oxidoreductase [Candidatus Omnitrophica bacterium]|nr:Gfo/Idh/MocA family oxidoreductase [Candidatus Omnitrophota bacterium]
MPQHEKVGVAVLGVRGYAAKIIQKIKQSARYDLRWCYHYDRQIASQFAHEYSCQGTHNLSDILSDEKVVGVFIVTPNEFHCEQISKALLAQKHVFVEKPMTATLKEADTVRELLNQHNKVFMVGHNYRRKSGVRKMKDMLDKGVLGQPVSVEFINSHGGGFHFSPQHWRTDVNRCPGGPLTMLGPHSFDTTEYLLGPVQRVFCWVKNVCVPIQCADTSACLLEMQQGAIAYFSHNYNVPSCAYLKLHASEGTVHYDLDSEVIAYRTGRDVNGVCARTEMIKIPLIDDRLEEIIEFADAIQEGKTVETGLKEAWRSVAFLESAMLSSKKACSIDIPIFEKKEKDV